MSTRGSVLPLILGITSPQVKLLLGSNIPSPSARCSILLRRNQNAVSKAAFRDLCSNDSLRKQRIICSKVIGTGSLTSVGPSNFSRLDSRSLMPGVFSNGSGPQSAMCFQRIAESFVRSVRALRLYLLRSRANQYITLLHISQGSSPSKELDQPLA